MSVASGKAGERNISLNVPIPENVDPAIEASLTATAEKILAILARSGSQESIIATADRLAQAMIGTFQPDTYLVEERIDRLRSIRKMLREGEWLTAAEINAAQENPPAQKSLPASDWKRRGRIFSVNHDGIDYYPRYAFDAAYRPLPVISEILKAFGAEADTWKIAAWFHFPNGYLTRNTPDGRSAMPPKDALDQRDKLLDAVRSRSSTYVA
jgi:hypothetical protein